MRRFLLLGGLVLSPVMLLAQPMGSIRFDTGRLRLGPDTFDIQISGDGLPPASMRVSTVRTLTRRGDVLVEVIETALGSGQGSIGRYQSIDSAEVTAADLRLRRIHSLLLDDNGKVIRELSATATGPTIERLQRENAEAPVRSSRTFPTATGAPVVVPFLAFRAAPLSAGWRAALSVYSVADDSLRSFQIDSLQTSLESERRVWLVYAQSESADRFAYVIDSLTRDLVRATITLSNKRQLVTYANRRYRSGGRVAAPGAVSAADSARLAPLVGRYVLQGVREAASELLLRPDGTFAFALTYGALDESGAGTWTVRDGVLILQSDGAPRRPTVTQVAASGVGSDSIKIVVEDSTGQSLSGISLDVSRHGAGRMTAQTSRDGYVIGFRRGMPPTEIGIGVSMLEFRVPFTLSSPPRASYRFRFDPGDLGTRRFEDERLTIEPGQLTMTMGGRALVYVRR